MERSNGLENKRGSYEPYNLYDIDYIGYRIDTTAMYAIPDSLYHIRRKTGIIH